MIYMRALSVKKKKKKYSFTFFILCNYVHNEHILLEIL